MRDDISKVVPLCAKQRGYLRSLRLAEPLISVPGPQICSGGSL